MHYHVSYSSLLELGGPFARESNPLILKMKREAQQFHVLFKVTESSVAESCTWAPGSCSAVSGYTNPGSDTCENTTETSANSLLPLGGSFLLLFYSQRKKIFLRGKHDCKVDLLPHFGYLKPAMLILRVNDRERHTFLAWLPNTPVHQMSID